MKLQELGIFDAKTHLSNMLEKVSKQGVTYRITKRGKAIAELKPISEGQPVKRLSYGYGKGTVLHMAKDFDAPLEDLQEYMR
jgi:prevent-host-death family protein